MRLTTYRRLRRGARILPAGLRRRVSDVILRNRDTYEHRRVFWEDKLADGYWDNENRLSNPVEEQKAEHIASAFVGFCSDAQSLHELGCGVGRNIRHLIRARPDLAVSGNDLSWEMCSRNMDSVVQGRMAFFEQDTLQFLQQQVAAGRQVDCVLVSDHLEHIPPEAIGEVLELISQYVRRYLLFKEGVRRSDKRSVSYWYAHDYKPLERRFSLIHAQGWDGGRSVGEYELRVYRRRA